jgi:hypothetical protein
MLGDFIFGLLKLNNWKAWNFENNPKQLKVKKKLIEVENVHTNFNLQTKAPSRGWLSHSHASLMQAKLCIDKWWRLLVRFPLSQKVSS